MHVIIYMYSLLTGKMEAADIYAVNIQTFNTYHTYQYISFNTIKHPFEKEDNTDLLYIPISVIINTCIITITTITILGISHINISHS